MHHQRGNILFLILLAIILFAALTYAVSSGLRGGGKSGGEESDRAAAAAILGHIAAVQNAVLRLTTTGGYRLDQISFGYNVPRYDGSVTLNTYHNSNCTTDACWVFKPGGGGVAPIGFEKYATPDPPGWLAAYAKPGFYDIYMAQWPGAKTDANDIVLRVMALKNSVCTTIRDQLNLPTAINTTGTFIAVNSVNNWDDTAQVAAPAAGTYGRDVGYALNSNYCFIYAMVAAR